MQLSRADRAHLKQLSRRSDLLGLRQGGLHLLLLAGLGASVWIGWQALGWAVLPLQAIYGTVLIFLFAPLHETIHRTAFASRWLNDGVAYLCGAVLILPPHYFRAFHLDHHRYTQITGKDPELPGKEIATVAEFLWHVTGLPYWRAALTGLVQRALGRGEEPFLATGSVHRKVMWEARAYLLLYSGAATGSWFLETWALVVLWLVPVLLGQPVLRLYLLAEHKLCPLVADMFQNTRTVKTHPLIRFLAWNMPYHTEHHLFMGVPFHRLPAVHARFHDRIVVQSDGYGAFHRQYWRHLTGKGG